MTSRLNRSGPAVLLAAAALALSMAGCATNASPVDLANVASANPPVPGGMKQGPAAVPTASGPAPNCGDPTASLRPPNPLPAPGQMPAGSTMARIAQRGYLIAGVDQNTYLFGYRSPTTNTLEGFDIDMARNIAAAIFGSRDKVVFKALTSAQRVPALKSGEVDIVARTFTISCARKQDVAFSTVYYQASQKVLVNANSPARSIDDLAGKKVCATTGADSLAHVLSRPKPPIPVAVQDWSDCLVLLQQGEVDAVTTDDTILAGMVAQDPNTKIIGSAIAPEPYGLAMPIKNTDFVSFVNGVLDEVRTNGSWTSSYQTWVGNRIGGSATPPQPIYSN